MLVGALVENGRERARQVHVVCAAVIHHDAQPLLHASNRKVSQGTIRSDIKSLRSAVNWAMTRNPPLLANCPFTIPKVATGTVKPFLPTEEIERHLESSDEEEQDDLLTTLKCCWNSLS